MPSDLNDLLERAVDRPSTAPDFDTLARTGRHRRYRQRAASGLAVVAVLALTSTVVLPRLRPPAVAFDTAPKAGVGTWETIPAAPIEARDDAWTFADDDRLVVIGGTPNDHDDIDDDGEHQLDGAAYDLRARQWAAIPAAPFLGPMDLLDDGRLLVVAPNGTKAALYDFATGAWVRTPTSPAPGSLEPVWHWTGDSLLVWGGGRTGDRGAVWNEASGEWTTMAPAPLRARTAMASVWTGTQMIVWGGATGNPMKGTEVAHDDGASYDLATNTWERLPDSPLRPRSAPTFWWDGSRLVIAGGYSAEEPVANNRSEPTSDPEIKCEESTDGLQGTVACSGSVEVSGPQSTMDAYHDGAAFDPASGKWTRIAEAPSGHSRTPFLVDDQLVAIKGDTLSLYDLEEDGWRAQPRAPRDDTYGEMHLVSGRLVHVNTEDLYNVTGADVLIGGVVLDRKHERWDALSEADSPRRTATSVTTSDDALFIWGGSITTHVGKGRGDYSTWEGRADGLMLTLD